MEAVVDSYAIPIVCTAEAPLFVGWRVGSSEELGVTATAKVRELPSGFRPGGLGEGGGNRLAQLFEFLNHIFDSPRHHLAQRLQGSGAGTLRGPAPEAEKSLQPICKFRGCTLLRLALAAEKSPQQVGVVRPALIEFGRSLQSQYGSLSYHPPPHEAIPQVDDGTVKGARHRRVDDRDGG